MTRNEFENSRIAEGTMHTGAQHIAAEPNTPITDTIPKDRNGGIPTRRVLGATMLTGDRVRNSAGDSLGKIEEIMLDLPSGRIAYAVLSFGGFLGIGDKLFMVPWSAMQIDQDEHEFVLDIPRGTLESAPGFDKDNWPDMADIGYVNQINRHYGITSAPESPAKM